MRIILLALLMIPLPALAQETASPTIDQVVAAAAGTPDTIVPADPFTISDVVVDVTAKNAVEARAQAFAKGSEIAVQKFLASQGADAGLNGVKPDSLVRDFRVDKEQFSRTRYTATLTYRFKPRAMAILANASLPPESALPVQPAATPSPVAPDGDAPWTPEAPTPVAAPSAGLTSWPLTVRYNEVPEWLQAQGLITARPEIRGYKVISMSGNHATLEITTQGAPAQIAQVWAGLGWATTPNGNGLAMDASAMH